MSAIRISAIVAVIVSLSTPSQGGIITIDPDSFASGTSLTNAFYGVTISRGNGATDIVAAVGITGTMQFALPFSGGVGAFGSLPIPPSSTLAATLAASGAVPATILRFDFDVATDFVSLDLISNDINDPGSIAAFDALGNLIDYDSFSGQNVIGVRNTLSVSGAGIRTLLAAGAPGPILGVTSETVDIDTLKYNSVSAVPEPSSLTLIGLGALIGVVRVRHRSRRRPESLPV